MKMMRKKRTFIIVMLTSLMFSFIMSGWGRERLYNEKVSEIVLIGEFNPGGLRSGNNAIFAELHNDEILIEFYQNIGSLLITIVDSMNNAVYSSTVDTSLHQNESICLSLIPGTYIITFSNGVDKMYGEFEVLSNIQ